ncbi:Ribonuclease P/MRP protein subunit POP5 [Lamellibrachia satsuma]|nr:Ribonuclease P/MRP protein subunit POP5 [Lamellibrachia satsuma]
MVRFKHRYLLCEIVQGGSGKCTFPITERQLYHNVRDVVSHAHGDYGLALVQAYLRVKYVNAQTHVVLIRVGRRAYHLVLSAMAMVKQIGQLQGFYRTLHVGGTIRSCQKFLAKYNKEQLNVLAKNSSPESYLQIQQSLLDSAAIAFSSLRPKKEVQESSDEDT